METMDFGIVHITSASARWLLSRGDLLRLKRAQGAKIVCQSGCLWLTEKGVPDDILLGAGEHYICMGPGLTVVSAERDSAFALVPATPPGSRRSTKSLLARLPLIGLGF